MLRVGTRKFVASRLASDKRFLILDSSEAAYVRLKNPCLRMLRGCENFPRFMLQAVDGSNIPTSN